MPRSPHAAKVMIKQVNEHLGRKPDGDAARTAATPVEDSLDGLGVYRSYTFDPVASKALLKVLPALNDPRVVGFDQAGKKGEEQVTVHFATTRVADTRDPFPLAAADLAEQAEGEDTPPPS